MLKMRAAAAPVFSIILLFGLTSQCQAQWVKTNVPPIGQARPLAVFGANLFIATGFGVFRSSDCGASWIEANAGLASPPVSSLVHIYDFAVSGTNIFAAAIPTGVFLSTDNGQSWKPVNSGLGEDSMGVSTLAVSGTYVFAGTLDGMFRSTNNGTNWEAAHAALGSTPIITLLVFGTSLFAGVNEGVICSTDNGKSWKSAGLNRNGVMALAVSGTDLYAGTANGAVYRSIDSGASWALASDGLSTPSINCVGSIAVSGNMIFVGTDYGGVFCSTDRGASWTAFNTGLTGTIVYDLAVLDSNLFAGTDNGLFRRSLSESIGVSDFHSIDRPEMFTLQQNFPNPFNPSTTIRYALPQRSHVILTVFNTLGQQITTLVDVVQDAGYHEARFGATGLASGVYFYRLQAGEYVETKKLLILR